MEKLKIKRIEDELSIKIDEHMSIIDLISKKDDANCSFTIARLDGIHSRRLNYKSTKIYYITQGELQIKVGGSEYVLKKGAIIRIPANVWIESFGVCCEFVIVCIPAFDVNDETVASKAV